MQRHVFLEELLTKVNDLHSAIEERVEEGEDLSLAIELLDELRDEIAYRLE